MTLTHGQKAQLKSHTLRIKGEWKRSIESLINIGHSLHEIRKILERKLFIEYIANEFSMSEVHAHRLEKLYLKFGNKKTKLVLSTKPSILYLLASNFDEKRIEALALGGKIKVGSQFKILSEITFDDVRELTKPVDRNLIKEKELEVDDDLHDEERFKSAPRAFITALESVNDWSLDINRFITEGRTIPNQSLLIKYVEETILCLEKLKNKLS